MQIRIKRSKAKKGSIPLVLLVVIVLGIGAGAAIFMTSGTSRLDKRAELNQRAWQFAQSAVEEILVKVTNNSADFAEDTRLTYDPQMTNKLAQEMGVEVKPVEILGRLAERPTNPAKMEEFLELMTAGPGFASPAALGGTAPDQWRTKLTAPGLLSMAGAQKGEGEKYWDDYHPQYLNKNDFQDGGQIRDAFYALQPLAPVPGAQTSPTAAHITATEVLTPEAAEADPNVGTFVKQWNLAMEEVADREKNRIDGCAGNPNYGVGARIAAFVLGGAADADADEEEDLRESAEDGGALDYKAYLVTVQAEAVAKGGGVSAPQAVTANRIVARVKMKAAMDILRTQIVPYLIGVYNLTPKDLELLGWIEPLPAGYDGTQPLKPRPQMLTRHFLRYPDSPGPKVMPFQASTCLMKVRS